MSKIFSNKLFKHLTCLVMTAFFLAPFSTSATALALCLDGEESHLVEQKLSLGDCHSSVEANLLLPDKYFPGVVEKDNRDCVDVSLSNSNALNFPSKLFLPVSAKVILSYDLPDNLTGFQQHVAGNTSSARTHPLLTASLLKAQRTIVLLI